MFTGFTGKDRPRYREELAPAERLVMAWAAGLPCWAMTFVSASLSQDIFILLSFEKLDRSNLWLLLFVGTDNGGSSWVLFRILHLSALVWSSSQIRIKPLLGICALGFEDPE